MKKDIKLTAKSTTFNLNTVADFNNLTDEDKYFVARCYLRQIISNNNKDINYILSTANLQSNDSRLNAYSRVNGAIKSIFTDEKVSKNLSELVATLNNAGKYNYKYIDYYDLYTLYCYNEYQKRFIRSILSYPEDASETFFTKVLNDTMTKDFNQTGKQFNETTYYGKHNYHSFAAPDVTENGFIQNLDCVYFRGSILDYDTDSINGSTLNIPNFKQNTNKFNEYRNTFPLLSAEDKKKWYESMVPSDVSRVEVSIQEFIKAKLAEKFNTIIIKENEEKKKLRTEIIKRDARKRYFYNKDRRHQYIKENVAKISLKSKLKPSDIILTLYPCDLNTTFRALQLNKFKSPNPYYERPLEKSTIYRKELKEKNEEKEYENSAIIYNKEKYYPLNIDRHFVDNSDFPLIPYGNPDWDDPELFVESHTNIIYKGPVFERILNENDEEELKFIDNPINDKLPD